MIGLGNEKKQKRILSLFLVLSILILLILSILFILFFTTRKNNAFEEETSDFLIDADEFGVSNHIFEVSLNNNNWIENLSEEQIELKVSDDRNYILEEGKDYYILDNSNKNDWKLVFKNEGTYELKYSAKFGNNSAYGSKSVKILYDKGITPIIIYDENYYVGTGDSVAEVSFADLSYSQDDDETGNRLIEVYYDNDDDGECETKILSESTDNYLFSFNTLLAGKYSAIVSMDEFLSEEVREAYGKEAVNSIHEEIFFEVRNENPSDNSCIMFLEKPQLLVLYNDRFKTSAVNKNIETAKEILNELGYAFESRIVRISNSGKVNFEQEICDVLSEYNNSENNLIVLDLCDLKNYISSNREQNVEKQLIEAEAELISLSNFNSYELAYYIINHQKSRATDRALWEGFASDQIEYKSNGYFTPVVCFNKFDTELQEYQSAQSMAVSYDESYVFVMLIKREIVEKEISEIPAMKVYKKNENGEYEELNTIYNLVNGHQNGATYYEKDGVAYVVIAAPFIDEEYSLVRYGIDLNNGNIISTDYIPLLQKGEFVKGIRSISFDKDEAAFYVTDGNRLLRYDENLSNGRTIRSKGKANYTANEGVPGAMSNNQDGTMDGSFFYSVSYYPNQINKYENIGLKNAELHGGASNSIITVFDKNTGDFVKFIILRADDIKNVTSKNYSKATENDMVEIEDIEFSDDKIFLLYQKNANFQILCADKSVFQNKRECEELTIAPLR